jgi:hypothetical protein
MKCYLFGEGASPVTLNPRVVQAIDNGKNESFGGKNTKV